MAKTKKDKKKKRDDVSGMFIPAGLFIGMGIGFLTGNLVAWLFIGMGAGFIAKILFHPQIKRK